MHSTTLGKDFPTSKKIIKSDIPIQTRASRKKTRQTMPKKKRVWFTCLSRRKWDGSTTLCHAHIQPHPKTKHFSAHTIRSLRTFHIRAAQKKATHLEEQQQKSNKIHAHSARLPQHPKGEEMCLYTMKPIYPPRLPACERKKKCVGMCVKLSGSVKTRN